MLFRSGGPNRQHGGRQAGLTALEAARRHLARFIAAHAAPCAEVWIVDPDRGNRPAFNRQMAAEGFGMSEERLGTEATDDAPAYKGRLLIYRRNV